MIHEHTALCVLYQKKELQLGLPGPPSNDGDGGLIRSGREAPAKFPAKR